MKKLLAVSFPALLLVSCASGGTGTISQQQLDNARAAFQSAVAVWTGYCAATQAPVCNDPKNIATEQAAEAIVNTALDTAQTKLDNGGLTSADIASLVATIAAYAATIAKLQGG